MHLSEDHDRHDSRSNVLIDSGQIVGSVRNFRFNQSLVELLCNVESLSTPVRASGEEAFDMVAPAIKVNGFHFTEVTRF
jgi:predicted Zn-dependent protease